VSTEEDQAPPASADQAEGRAEGQAEGQAAREPSWWHRDHPTFTSLAGFFTGLLFVILVPGAYAGLLSVLVEQDTAEELFPLVLVTLAVPVTLAVLPRTRRFGRYMLIGIVTTAVVVLATAALVLWVLYRTDG
jgi:hypothetical protein